MLARRRRQISAQAWRRSRAPTAPQLLLLPLLLPIRPTRTRRRLQLLPPRRPARELAQLHAADGGVNVGHARVETNDLVAVARLHPLIAQQPHLPGAQGEHPRAVADLRQQLQRRIGRQLERELARVRQYGIARDNEELELGVRCMAAGIYDDQGKLVAGLSVSAPADRLELARRMGADLVLDVTTTTPADPIAVEAATLAVTWVKVVTRSAAPVATEAATVEVDGASLTTAKPVGATLAAMVASSLPTARAGPNVIDAARVAVSLRLFPRLAGPSVTEEPITAISSIGMIPLATPNVALAAMVAKNFCSCAKLPVGKTLAAMVAVTCRSA